MLEDPGRASGQGAFWAEIGVGVRVGVGGCGGKTRGGVGWGGSRYGSVRV